MGAPGYVPRGVRRVDVMRRALLATAEEHDMQISLKDVERLGLSVVTALYGDGGSLLPEMDPVSPRAQRDEVIAGTRIKSNQVEYLRMLANGLTMEEMARSIGRSKNTVKFNVTAIYRALGAENACHAVALSLVFGLISPEDVIRPRPEQDPREYLC